ncbi:hypothetical protein N657DRAFT_645700 [Parathielavia appendiculata]|uniref:Uncharacterized protein n=1 Tax=Parathielavia appendiculata TaxID=2587402 RepID=A0AAN6TYI8_9PEZI|nr:hypothetical protein N657DRAFT_645700 [Parathielavia appendiculata]
MFLPNTSASSKAMEIAIPQNPPTFPFYLPQHKGTLPAIKAPTPTASPYFTSFMTHLRLTGHLVRRTGS